MPGAVLKVNLYLDRWQDVVHGVLRGTVTIFSKLLGRPILNAAAKAKLKIT